jgi:hypothetical protein
MQEGKVIICANRTNTLQHTIKKWKSAAGRQTEETLQKLAETPICE